MVLDDVKALLLDLHQGSQVLEQLIHLHHHAKPHGVTCYLEAWAVNQTGHIHRESRQRESRQRESRERELREHTHLQHLLFQLEDVQVALLDILRKSNMMRSDEEDDIVQPGCSVQEMGDGRRLPFRA